MTAIQTSGGKVCEGRGCKDCASSLVSVLQRLRPSLLQFCFTSMGFLFMFSPSPCTLRLSCRTHRRDDCCDLNCVGAVECVQWECLFESPTRTPGKVDSWWTFTGFPMKPRNAAFNKHANRCTSRHACLSTSSLTTFTCMTTLDSGFPYFLGPSDSSDKPSTLLIQGPSSIRSSSRSGSPGATAWDRQELNLLSPTKLAQISIPWKHPTFWSLLNFLEMLDGFNGSASDLGNARHSVTKRCLWRASKARNSEVRSRWSRCQWQCHKVPFFGNHIF